MKSIRLLFVLIALLLGNIVSHGFDIRGMHVDLRAEVMTINALKDLATKAAEGGINTLIMEYEATFPFVENATICNDQAYTREEIKDFINHCTRLGIDVIPLQNCFGHCEYILRHERYASIRESASDRSQVCPCQEEQAKEIFRSIFSEIIQLHTSKYIHIGADETRLLGNCKLCSAKMAKYGQSKLFCDYIIAMCEVVRELGKTPIIWGDILTKYPEAADSLPKDLVVIDWNYGWSMNQFGDFLSFIKRGFNMWGAPSLRSHPDDINNVQWMKHFNNLKDYVWSVKQLGFKGIVETSWSTSGEYGYIRGTNNVVVDIQPIRQVYPLSGFAILQAAFCEAASSDRQFEPEGFIRRYCAEKYGFDKASTDLMLEFFNMPQNQFDGRNAKDIPDELKATEEMRAKIYGLRPKSSKVEIEHFKMMLDIRINFLNFLQIKFQVENDNYKASGAKALATQLRPVITECKVLQKRFCKLNINYLKHPERSYGLWDYTDEMDKLYSRIR